MESSSQPVELSPAEIELDEYSERLERIIGTQREVAGLDHDLQAMIDLICERTQELTGADAGTILMQDGDDLVHRAGSGFSAGIAGFRLGIDDTFSGSVCRSNRSATATARRRSPIRSRCSAESGRSSPSRCGTATTRSESCRCSRSSRTRSPTGISRRSSCSRSSCRRRSVMQPSSTRAGRRWKRLPASAPLGSAEETEHAA